MPETSSPVLPTTTTTATTGNSSNSQNSSPVLLVKEESNVSVLHLKNLKSNNSRILPATASVENAQPYPLGQKIRIKWGKVFYTPKGVRPQHHLIVAWLGRVGFIAKGIVYAVMGGLCIATAQHLKGDITGTESPMGAFIFLGLFSIGTPILVVMFIGILFYSIWRFWEGLTGQGYDALCSHFANFFRARLSPIVSGMVYIVYLVYIGQLLSQTREERMQSALNSTGCFPSCWASSDKVEYRMAVGVFGVAFVIAFFTQAQNGVSRRWHNDLKLSECTRFEKYLIYVLGHLGFLARAGVFMFVAVFMFRTLIHPSIVSQRDAFSDAINQAISVHGGFIGLWFLGIGLILFGLFAVLNAYYKYYPTPPPSRNYVFERKDAHDDTIPLRQECPKDANGVNRSSELDSSTSFSAINIPRD